MKVQYSTKEMYTIKQSIADQLARDDVKFIRIDGSFFKRVHDVEKGIMYIELCVPRIRLKDFEELN